MYIKTCVRQEKQLGYLAECGTEYFYGKIFSRSYESKGPGLIICTNKFILFSNILSYSNGHWSSLSKTHNDIAFQQHLISN